mmetsp:Transcript_20158/g.50171  ORF Transcript_20158/g.50171 Transcript_20158/m.50171 type:complete len:110 (-) Transcript_20158:175-504(-)
MQTKVFHLSRILVHHLVQTISDLEILFFSYRLTHRIAIPTFVSQLFARSKRKRKVHMEQQRTFFFLRAPIAAAAPAVAAAVLLSPLLFPPARPLFLGGGNAIMSKSRNN